MQIQLARQPWYAVITLLCTTILIASCGGATGDTAATTDQSSTEGSGDTVATGEQVTLRWYMRWDQARLDNVATPVIEAFEEQNPNINIEIENVGSGSEYWTKLQTMIAGNTAPDIIYPATHQAYALASKGALVNLDAYIEQDSVDMTQYDPAILDLYTYEESVYGLPLDTAALAVFYNKNMFDEAGLEYPAEGWTWDDFLTTAQALSQDTDGDGRTDQFGVDDWTAYWPVIVWSNTGHGIFDDLRQPTSWLLSEPESVEAIQWLSDLSNEHGVMPTVEERADISDMFVANKTGMKIIGHWRVRQYMENVEDFEWDIAPLPQGEIAANRSDGSAFAVTTQSEHPEEAWQFIKFLAGPESYGVDLLLDLQQMTPALTEFQQADEFLNPESLPGINKEAFLSGKENLFPMYDPIHPVYDEIETIQNSELAELWNGNVTAQEAVERMQPQIEQILEGM